MILAVGVAAWVLIKGYFMRPSCLYSMCPVHDPTVWPRLGFLLICTILALWLLKTPTQGSVATEDGLKPADPTESKAEASSPEQKVEASSSDTKQS